MSDVPAETPDGAAEAAQGAVEPQVEAPATERPVMPDGWTGEFDPHRAKATIDRLREFERQVNNLGSDPDAAARFMAERHGWELADDEPVYDAPDDEGFDDPHASEIAELKAWKESQEQQQTEAAIASHVGELTAESDLSLEEKQWLFEQAKAPGFTEKRTEQLVSQYLARAKAREEAAIERYLESKRAPAPPQEGKAGEPKPDPWDSDARAARIAARITAGES